MRMIEEAMEVITLLPQNGGVGRIFPPEISGYNFEAISSLNVDLSGLV
jgi:hypothetical protein